MKYILLSLAFIGVLAAIWYRPLTQNGCRFSALDVGQGDAILIQTADHQDILIDGGPDDRVIEQLGRMLPAGDRDIELMVLTHPHADHVNGLVSVTERYEVHHVLESGVLYRQLAYQRWHTLLDEHHITRLDASAGQIFTVGQARLEVLWPAQSLSQQKIINDNAAEGGGVNDTSLVLRLFCGGSAAMLMGDASSEIEQRILDRGGNVQADLLKVGHHGSRFSSSRNWITAVQPTWAIISSGLNNRYHHPHPTTLLRLQQLVPHILRTDQIGTITLQTNGRGGWIK